MFEVRFDDEANILHLRLVGCWTIATFAKFAMALLYHAFRLGLSGRRYGVLSDASAFAVQPPAIAAAFERIMNHEKAQRADAIAIVVGSTLNRLQARRTVHGPNVRIFDGRSEALAWLNEELAVAVAA